MERVLILGCSGAGKSTLARRMGTITGLPVIHLDREYWQAGWTPREDGEFTRNVARLLEQPRWIIDGNYNRNLALRLARADTVIHLDFPRWRCLYRICKRVLLNARFKHDRPDMPEGCGEQWDWEFVEWVWNFRREVNPQTVEYLAKGAGRAKVITLRRPGEVAGFLKRIKESTSAKESIVASTTQ